MMTNDEAARRTAGSIPVADELAENLTTEAQTGCDVAHLHRRGDRRPLGSAPGEMVPVRLDPDLRAALIAHAQAEHTNVSDVIRQARSA
jgi:hypothetical protein